MILFDLDGTLTDPLVGVQRSMNYALSHFGFAELSLAQAALYIGPPLDLTFSQITQRSSTTLISDLVAKYRERYAEIGYSENSVYSGIPEALAYLHKTGVKLAVCTSKRTDFAEKILDLFALRQYFKFVDGGDIGMHKWQQVERLLSGGRVEPTAVMVGDRAVDMLAANRAGWSCAAALWGYGTRHELEAEKPNYFFGVPAELRSFVE